MNSIITRVYVEIIYILTPFSILESAEINMKQLCLGFMGIIT